MSASALTTNTLWKLMSHILARGSLILASIVLARKLDPVAFAEFSYFQLTAVTISAYAALGLGVTASKFFAEVSFDDDRDSYPAITLMWAISISVSVIFFVGVMIAPVSWFPGNLTIPRWLLALAVLAFALEIVPTGALMGLECYRPVAGLSVIAAGIMLIGAWGAASEGSSKLAMITITFASALQVVGKSWIIIRLMRWKRLARWHSVNWRRLNEICNFAGPMLFVSLLSGSGTWVLGKIILDGPGGPLAFAHYAIGLQWFSLGLFLPTILSQVILPRLVRASREGASTRQLTHHSAWAAAIMALAVSAGAFLFCALIPDIYGGNYENERWFIAAYLAAAIILAPANTIGNAIVANNGQRAWLFLTCIWMLVLLGSAATTVSLMAWAGAISQAAAAAALVTGAIIVARGRGLI
ncbi:hypothetical protein LMG23992_03452 [Cupriavidus laharis]|uniref:Polysaccharide biosynthesis protein n=1 Tax=Cupriavidus laharis TaxID=151654 RepID=A0ABM8XBD3_9BURK|nr:hypothetical protein [Cupriavidus laharis]CAG9177248.1 hypothetical protein LMG23992_03452 [Cupriavidus laharis]